MKPKFTEQTIYYRIVSKESVTVIVTPVFPNHLEFNLLQAEKAKQKKEARALLGDKARQIKEMIDDYDMPENKKQILNMLEILHDQTKAKSEEQYASALANEQRRVEIEEAEKSYFEKTKPEVKELPPIKEKLTNAQLDVYSKAKAALSREVGA